MEHRSFAERVLFTSILGEDVHSQAGSLKRFLTQKYLEAADFLQNVVFISVPLSEEEKIQRYETLAYLYADLGMHRKAAFFRRVAAMQCVAPTCPHPGWRRCYDLLIQALDGYRIHLNPREMPNDYTIGWSVIQMRVLHELIYSARKMGNPAVAVRHVSYLLHVFFDHLSRQDRREIAGVLESYTAKCEGTAQTLAIDNTLLPPVPMSKFPLVRTFVVSELVPSLRPVHLSQEKAVTSVVTASPFIYSALTETKKSVIKADKEIEFDWVASEVCEVNLQVYNPLPFELTVASMSLLVEGVEFEAYPASLNLPEESGPYPVKLIGVPKEHGLLKIIGYTAEVLGVRNTCRLRDLHGLRNLLPTDRDTLDVSVVPSLPQMMVSTNLPKAASFSSSAEQAPVVTSASACLYDGEQRECQVKFTNVGSHVIETISLRFESKLPHDAVEEVFMYQEDNVQVQLPLAPGAHLCFTIQIHGVLRSILPHAPPNVEAAGSDSRSLPGSSVESVQQDVSSAHMVDALLVARYGAEEGASAVRECAVAFAVEVQPTIAVLGMTVQPTPQAEYCSLIFDVENLTTQELQLKLDSKRKIIAESRQLRRFEMEVQRLRPLPGQAWTCAQLDPHLVLSLSASIMQRLREFVDIRWRLLESGNEGTLSLSQVTLLSEFIPVVMASPVSWSVTTSPPADDDVIRVSVAEQVELSVSATNASEDCEVLDGQVMVSCFQDSGMDLRAADGPEAEVVVLGVNPTTFEKLKPGTSSNLTCGVMFLHAGEYILEASCEGCISQGVKVTPRPVVRRTETVDTDVSHVTDSEEDSAASEQWRCPLAVRVVCSRC